MTRQRRVLLGTLALAIATCSMLAPTVVGLMLALVGAVP